VSLVDCGEDHAWGFGEHLAPEMVSADRERRG
jgi:hypothetical protein